MDNVTATVQPIANPDEKSQICRAVLTNLPDWFGIPESIDEYVDDVRDMPFYAVFSDGQAIGFLALALHNAHTAEIHVMGVHAAFHRRGIGHMLVDEATKLCRETGCIFLTVKTLDDSDPNEPYARTRTFYRAMGFYPLEVLKGYWGETNLCLLMGKNI